MKQTMCVGIHAKNQIQKIMLLRAIGLTNTQIASLMGVNEASISRILSKVQQEVLDGEYGSVFIGCALPFIQEVKEDRIGSVGEMLRSQLQRLNQLPHRGRKVVKGNR